MYYDRDDYDDMVADARADAAREAWDDEIEEALSCIFDDEWEDAVAKYNALFPDKALHETDDDYLRDVARKDEDFQEWFREEYREWAEESVSESRAMEETYNSMRGAL